jgi:glycerol kinase
MFWQRYSSPEARMSRYLLALDQGTTSSRAIVFSEDGDIRAVAQRELRQIFPQPGWVEHDPADIWNTQLETARWALADAAITPNDVAAIGITNQRETTLLWDRRTGQTLHNAIVWQDRRTADRCAALRRNAAVVTLIQRQTGLIPDAYFSASKLEWLLDHVPQARDRAAHGDLAFGTVDSWLLWNLTGGSRRGVHATDVSNASRTMLFNIHTGQWDEELLGLFNVPRELLPEVRPSAGFFGHASAIVPGTEVPITGIAGDQQAALFGQTCVSPGRAKNTYGTGCFLLMNTGPNAALSRNRLLTTVAWQIPQSKITYALEGSVFVGGAVVQWLRDGLGLIQSAADIEPLAQSVSNSAGVYLVPAFAGLGAPHWDQYARGTIVGLTRATSKAHLARAALEAIAFQVADLLDTMHADLPDMPIAELRVDGGAARNNLLLQIQADFLQRPVLRPKTTETTALGAALLAGLGAGVYKDTSELTTLWKPDAQFAPRISPAQAASRRSRWNEALARARDWETHDASA